MGWLYTYKDPEVPPGKFLMDRGSFGEVGLSSDGILTCNVLDMATVNRTTLYAAVEHVYERDFSFIHSKKTKHVGDRDVFALVYLLNYQPNDSHNFGWKDMDETMGPFEDKCPERILKVLTPTDNEYANGWRQRCQENISRRSRISSLKVGDVIEFDSPLSFGKWGEHSRFTVEAKSPKLTFAAKGAWASFRIRRDNLLRDGYKVIRDGQVIGDYSKLPKEVSPISTEQISFEEETAAGLSR